MQEIVKPGTDNQLAGDYIEVDSNGNNIEHPRHCTIDQGDRLPPTQAKGHMWKYIG